MNATIEVVCYKSKVLANNESPLMLRITKDRKRKYSSIGLSLNPVYWDFEKNKPRPLRRLGVEHSAIVMA